MPSKKRDMKHNIWFACPDCSSQRPAPFLPPCPNCGFSLDHLNGRQLSDWQRQKWKKHQELLQGSNISLHGGKWNASFTHNGNAALEDLVRFTISYGDTQVLSSPRGNNQNPVYLAYIPEIIGSGLAIATPGLVPCSGLCIVSPSSIQYGHTYPILDDWMQDHFSGLGSSCRLCHTPTAFGEVFCMQCYSGYANGDWQKLLMN